MEVRSTQEARANIEEFSIRYLNFLMDKKSLDNDIKQLKEEFKEEGVPVAIVNGVINKIKAAMKKSDSEKFEEDKIKEWLESNTQIEDKIGQLID